MFVPFGMFGGVHVTSRNIRDVWWGACVSSFRDVWWGAHTRVCVSFGMKIEEAAARSPNLVESATRHPPPSTLNPPPSTLQPQPSTLHPQFSTLNPKISTHSPKPLTCQLTHSPEPLTYQLTHSPKPLTCQIEKATELGAGVLQPVVCARGGAQPAGQPPHPLTQWVRPRALQIV